VVFAICTMLIGCIGDRATDVFVTNHLSEDIEVRICVPGYPKRPPENIKAAERKSVGTVFLMGDRTASLEYIGRTRKGSVPIPGEEIADFKCELIVK